MDKSLKAACIGEFLGTALLIFFGVGCVAALKVAEQTLDSGKSVSCGVRSRNRGLRFRRSFWCTSQSRRHDRVMAVCLF